VAIINAILCLWLIPKNGWVGAVWASLISDGILALLIWGCIFLSSQTTKINIKPQNELVN
jgi:O-antigen/teichoic acid export membrane protein